MQQTAELQLVLRSVEGGSSNAQARGELARILRLEDRIVGSIIDRAPIVLMRDVGPDEARLAEGGLRQLTAAGIEVEMTSEAVGLPKVNWPTQPRMTDLFPMAREVAPEVQALLDRVAHLEARVAELESAVGMSPVAAPAAAAPAPASAPTPAAAPSAAPAPAAPAARQLPPMPAGALDAVPALAGELFWASSDVADAIPFAETGDNGAVSAGGRGGAPGGAVEHEVAPSAGGSDDLVELEPLDLSDDLGPGVELEPLEPLDEAPIELEPVGGAEDPIELEPVGGDDDDDDGLPAWTGRARDYKSDKKEKVEDDDGLEPWTGRARDYTPESSRSDAADVDAADDVADLPELDLSDDDDEPLVAPTIPPQGKPKKPAAKKRQKPAPVDDLPELEPVLGDEGVKRKPSKKKAKKGKTAAAKKPAKKAAKGKPARTKGGGDFSVFLSKIAGASKKQAAIELLCEIKGIDEDDAAALCNKMIIPVAQGVSKEDAEDLLGQFAAHKIQGRITRKKK